MELKQLIAKYESLKRNSVNWLERLTEGNEDYTNECRSIAMYDMILSDLNHATIPNPTDRGIE